MDRQAQPASPYTSFARQLVKSHTIGFTIKNNEISFDSDIPKNVRDKFKEFYVFKIRPVVAYHQMFGHFIVITAAGDGPIIIWAENAITATADGIEPADPQKGAS